MAVAMMVDDPEGSQEIHERVRDLLAVAGPAGGILRLAGPSPNGGWRRDRGLGVGEGRARVPPGAPPPGRRGRRGTNSAAAAVLACPRLRRVGHGGARRQR